MTTPTVLTIYHRHAHSHGVTVPYANLSDDGRRHWIALAQRWWNLHPRKPRNYRTRALYDATLP